MVQSLDGGDARLVLASATDGRLLPSGQLAFMRLGTLMIMAFDLTRAQATGDAVAVLGGVMQSGLRSRAGANNTGAGMFAVSSLGTLAVVRGSLTGGEGGHLSWVTSDGQTSSAEPSSGAPAGGRLYSHISPDQSRATVNVITATRFELWIADSKRGVWTACGDCSGDLLLPVLWAPDGHRLLISRDNTLVAHTLDGSAPEQVLVREPAQELIPAAWLTDGRIVYESISEAGDEIKLLESDGSGGRVVVPARMGKNPDVSPDGRWLAYVTTQSGQPSTVVVQAFPGPGARIPVSAGDAQDPVWSADGRTLYYTGSVPDPPGSGAVFAADIRTTGTLAAGTPRVLFKMPRPNNCNPRCYDVSADGSRFLLREDDTAKRGSVTRMDLVLNWTATLPKTK